LKILIVNQPTNNRGDEAAHRSLVRGLIREFPEDTIEVIFHGVKSDSVRQMSVISPSVKYTNIPTPNTRLYDWIMRYGLRFGIERLLSRFHPTHRETIRLIRASNLVICAPGGICMGLFQFWPHIYWLRVAQLYKKPIAYYGRSFGPFPNQTIWDKVFEKTSRNLLSYMEFVSIRDNVSMNLAKSMGLQYHPTIDTAFLDCPEEKLPQELQQTLSQSPYIVFVPNELKWHGAYKNSSSEIWEYLYVRLIGILLAEHPQSKIIMLPQLFNTENGDEVYFHHLAKIVNTDRVVVIPEQYGSDIQQAIIRNSMLVIGARYHSIVFAINNIIPFVALSYEHKMSGLLDILGRSDRMIDIQKCRNIEDADKILNEVARKIKKLNSDEQSKKLAREIAMNCLTHLKSFVTDTRFKT
jgi:colanic acid/amylovoran biosynthesis protein